jgi:hypothetical protein
MNVTLALIRKLRRLAAGDKLPASMLRGEWVDRLVRDGVLAKHRQGSRSTLSAPSADMLLEELKLLDPRLANLDEAERLVGGEAMSRSEQVALTGDSKAIARATCPGFMVNSFAPVSATLRGEPMEVAPREGTLLFVSDWEAFRPAADVLVVGVENMESFLEVRRQRALFEQFLHPGERQLLFVARYPQSSSLRRWLLGIPNRYLHFGDFDLAGIAIYQNEFARHLGPRASLLIPSDIAERLPRGSAERYNAQYDRYRGLTSAEPDVANLIALIHRFRRGYDQEGYIER